MFSRQFRKHGKYTSWALLSLLLTCFMHFTFWCEMLVMRNVFHIFYIHIYTGPIPLSTYMRIYKKGDIVDIKVSWYNKHVGFSLGSALEVIHFVPPANELQTNSDHFMFHCPFRKALIVAYRPSLIFAIARGHIFVILLLCVADRKNI